MLFWDRDIPGFGVRVYATGRKVYVVQVRGPVGNPKRVRIGVHGEIAPDEARGRAAAVIDRIRRGEDPFPPEPAPEPTMADLADRYVTAHLEVNCRPGTIATFRRVLDLHILPELGHLLGGVGGALPRVRSPFQDAGQARAGEPGGGDSLQDVSACRGVGDDAAQAQPLQVGAPI